MRKLDDIASRAMFIEYLQFERGYTLLDFVNNQVVVRRDVKLDEEESPFVESMEDETSVDVEIDLRESETQQQNSSSNEDTVRTPADLSANASSNKSMHGTTARNVTSGLGHNEQGTTTCRSSPIRYAPRSGGSNFRHFQHLVSSTNCRKTRRRSENSQKHENGNGAGNEHTAQKRDMEART